MFPNVTKKFRERWTPEEINADSVRWGYRLFLDREPESDAVIVDKLHALKTTFEVRKAFLKSEEFRSKNTGMTQTSLAGDEPPLEIQPLHSEAELRALFEHIQKTWQQLGNTEPYWSVLSAEQFLRKNIHDENAVSEFYETGKNDVQRILKTLERNRIDRSALKSCLEYGCGLGRVTRWLAEIFPIVHGYDISQPHLSAAQAYCDRNDVKNVVLHYLAQFESVKNLPPVDFIYSVIVLQHNPPPVIAFLIRQFLRALHPHGIAYFQVPTYRQGYSFALQEYLRNEAKLQAIEMHVIPQKEVFQIIRQENGNVLEVLEDTWTGLRHKELSNTFVVQKGR